jgi:hypothetical protein
MITRLHTFTYHYFSIYYLALYFFFINLNYKRFVHKIDNKIETGISLSTYSPLDLRSKENKILLDLQYKNMVYIYTVDTRSVSCTIDSEGKILGHRSTQDQKDFTNLITSTTKLNKKLIHSTLFGSIKLIKI